MPAGKKTLSSPPAIAFATHNLSVMTHPWMLNEELSIRDGVFMPCLKNKIRFRRLSHIQFYLQFSIKSLRKFRTPESVDNKRQIAEILASCPILAVCI